MRDYGIDKGSVRYLDDSKRDHRGWSQGFWGFRKMFRDYLTKLNVAFYDTCCPESTPGRTLFPYTTLFRSKNLGSNLCGLF